MDEIPAGSDGNSGVNLGYGMKDLSMFDDRLGGKLYADALGLYRDIMAVLPSQEWVHWSQCVNAAGSMVANIAEANGRDRAGVKYYQNFLLHSRGSSYEVLSWLHVGCIDGVIKSNDALCLGERLITLGDALFKEIMRR